MNLSKKKRKSEKDLRKGISKQLGYVKRDIKIINYLLDLLKNKGIDHVFDKHELKYFYVIQHVFDQQHQMHRNREHSVDDRIVSIHQPHVRPVVIFTRRFYPELVQVDKIYLNRENRAWPISFCERNQIEGKFGQGKRGYGLNNIKARTASISMSWIGAIIFVMNLIRYLKVSSSLFLTVIVNCILTKLLRMKQIILTKTPNPAFNFAGFGIIQ